MDTQLLREIIEGTAELLRGRVHPRRGTVTVSPEVAARWQALSFAATETVAETLPIVAPEAAGPARKSETPAAASHAGHAASSLSALRAIVAECRGCNLCESRTQTVFADGSEAAELVFVGEAPGEQEDLQGLPFVGRAGQLLTDIIEKGMKMQRQDVYICNVLKCRPPQNRDPLPEEKKECEPYLVRQLELIRPKVIVALGAHAAKTLLRTDDATGKLRGKWHFYHGIPLRVTYHPAYLLRSPGEKRKTWEDIQEVMKVLEGEVAPEPGGGYVVN